MEIFLNLVWLCVSLALTGWWIAAVRRGDSHREWGTFVALLLLLLLLFPVISMTDDLMAMNAPADAEHLFRRHEQPIPVAPMLQLGIALLGLALLGFAACLFASGRALVDSFEARLREGCVRAFGVRPPPAFCAAHA